MTISELIYQYYRKNPNGHYFDYDTLKFFGERRSEMRVLKNPVQIKDSCGNDHTAYAVSSIQRYKNYNGKTTTRRHYAYFDTTTFDHIIT